MEKQNLIALVLAKLKAKLIPEEEQWRWNA